MEPYHWKFDWIMLCGISKQQKKEMFHTRLNNFSVFRNYRDIDFCIALYGRSGNNHLNLNELKFYVKFCEIKTEDFQATFLILLA